MAIHYRLSEVELIFDVSFTPEQRTALENIPFAEEVLEACDGAHMLFPGFPLSLLDIREKHADLFYSQASDWHGEDKQPFSQALVPVRWHLIRTTPVPDSFSKTWKEQCELLLQGEEVPSAATVAFATMLHFKATGWRLFERCYVRTSDVDSGGDRVDVGDFDAGGFVVSDGWDGIRYDDLGLSASRKI